MGGNQEMSAKWIWYPGDFELYHHMLVHSRRTEYDHDYPAMWHVSRPEFMCRFLKTVELSEPLETTIYARGKGYVRAKGRFLGDVNHPVTFPAGKYEVEVAVLNIETFPSIYCETAALRTDETWQADLQDGQPRPAGGEPCFTGPEADPSVFPFSYADLKPVSEEAADGGVLYDFGTESFGPVTVIRTREMGEVGLFYGESREEALDTEWTLIRKRYAAGDDPIEAPSRAFRYLFVTAESGRPEIRAKLEYLPIADKASFTCDDEALPKIWEICDRAFHLNSREFYLDGIKRDRWVWSGDAYQSCMINRYLYAEPGIVRRTIRALLGKPPYKQHINTINDYSAYMFLSVYEHYFATGDRAFVASVWELLKELYRFIVSRLDGETGYVVKRPGDWIFIDWHRFDLDGPLCAEQILLHEVYRAMARLADLMGESGDYTVRAEQLKARILQDYWDEEKSAFIDSYTSGKRQVTRHANIFAVLYQFADAEKQQRILRNVLLNERIPEITTPYFKLFELMALAQLSQIEHVQDYIDSYWGGMIANGATSAWEEYIPSRRGIEHYEMYGDKYGCSLCHAWGSGPILLLGKYCAGVKPTSTGAQTFVVAPNPGRYQHFDAVVPIREGTVSVRYVDGHLTVETDVPGGMLDFRGNMIPIPAGEKIIL